MKRALGACLLIPFLLSASTGSRWAYAVRAQAPRAYKLTRQKFLQPTEERRLYRQQASTDKQGPGPASAVGMEFSTGFCSRITSADLLDAVRRPGPDFYQLMVLLI